jgi:hypothetical protein
MYYASDIVLPIVNVPTNLADKTLHSTIGIAEFGWAVRNGIDGMKPEERRKALGYFQDGLLGIGLGAIALSNNNTYIDDKTHELIFCGVRLPTVFDHIPPILAVRLFAEAKKEYSKKNPAQGVIEKTMRAGLAMATELKEAVPFLKEGLIFGKSVQSTLNKWEDIAISFFVPQLSSEIARFIDPRTGEMNWGKFFGAAKAYYKPKNFPERVKSKLPGASQDIEVTTGGKKKSSTTSSPNIKGKEIKGQSLKGRNPLKGKR